MHTYVHAYHEFINTTIRSVYVLCFNFSNEHPIIQRSETLYDTCNPVWTTEFEFKVYDDIMVS